MDAHEGHASSATLSSEKDAQDAHLVKLVSLNQPLSELCGGSSPLNGTSLCEVADVGRFLFLGFDSDCFGCYALGFLAACASGFLAPLPPSQLNCDAPPLRWHHPPRLGHTLSYARIGRSVPLCFSVAGFLYSLMVSLLTRGLPWWADLSYLR